jgi:hypothetical protein
MSVAIPPSRGVSAATGTGACACVSVDAGALTWPLLARTGLPARVPAPPGGILVALEQRDPIAPLRFKQPLQVLARARRRLPAQRCSCVTVHTASARTCTHQRRTPRGRRSGGAAGTADTHDFTDDADDSLRGRGILPAAVLLDPAGQLEKGSPGTIRGI